MTDDPLLAEDNLVLIQQIIATDWTLLPFEELQYLNPTKSESELRDSLAELHRYGYITIQTNKNTPDNVPNTFYAATLHAEDTLKEYGLWDGLGILYQVYEAVEQTDRIKHIRQYYPDGPIVTTAKENAT